MLKESFYNTIDVSGQIKIEYELKAKSQEELVLWIFQQERKPLAWFEVQKLLPEMNEISLKRSITNLSKGVDRELIKTSEQVLGKYGKPCYRYRLL